MKRILITGMSGTGKSSVTAELARRGYTSVDADSDVYSHWVEVPAGADAYGTTVEPGRDWVWREDRMQQRLTTEDTDLLFISGSAANMRQFLPQFDHIVLLSAPADLIVKRLATRTNNDYGKHPDEVARVLGLIDTIEPLLRRVSGHEIDTSASLDDVVNALLRIVDA